MSPGQGGSNQSVRVHSATWMWIASISHRQGSERALCGEWIQLCGDASQCGASRFPLIWQGQARHKRDQRTNQLLYIVKRTAERDG